MAFTIYFGNRATVDNDPGPDQGAILEGNNRTLVAPPEDAKLAEAFADITRPGGIWERHSAAPPAWVAVDHEDPDVADALATLLAKHYGCEIRDPDPQEA